MDDYVVNVDHVASVADLDNFTRCGERSWQGGTGRHYVGRIPMCK